jgi:hypothetical protein
MHGIQLRPIYVMSTNVPRVRIRKGGQLGK